MEEKEKNIENESEYFGPLYPYVLDEDITDVDYNGKELWLDRPEVRVNRLDLPDYITQKALSQIQPLLDLNRFPLPLNLHKVTLEKGKAILSTRTLPKPIERGITYHYLSR